MSKRLIVELTDDQALEWSDWNEVAAARIVSLGDGTARLELTDDLDRITRPEGAS